MYTLGEAAKAVGKSKATLSKAIKTGKISAERQGNGFYKIDPSELHRVFPIEPSAEQIRIPDEHLQLRELELQLEAARQRLEDKEEQLADIREDRDRWRQQAQALLTDQRPTKGFWARLFNTK